MGLYQKYILPHLINLSMGDKVAMRCRSEIIPGASGRVLEIGMGSGFNLAFYGPEVTHVWGIEPSAELLAMARPKAEGLPFSVDFIEAPAETIDLPDNTADSAVFTWVLCSIPDPAPVLAEVRRILKPGGRVIFVEHGEAPDTGIRKLQNSVNPFWKRCAGGCNLNRRADQTLTEAGFELLEFSASYLPGPRFLNYTYRGIAT